MQYHAPTQRHARFLIIKAGTGLPDERIKDIMLGFDKDCIHHEPSAQAFASALMTIVGDPRDGDIPYEECLAILGIEA